MKEKVEYITPFSNGSEAIDWTFHNCEICARAYKPEAGQELPGLEETKQLIKEGKECRMKAYIDLGFITGQIPRFIAEQIGYENSRLESCKKFTTEPVAIQPAYNPNQLTLFDNLSSLNKNHTYDI